MNRRRWHHCGTPRLPVHGLHPPPWPALPPHTGIGPEPRLAQTLEVSPPRAAASGKEQEASLWATKAPQLILKLIEDSSQGRRPSDALLLQTNSLIPTMGPQSLVGCQFCRSQPFRAFDSACRITGVEYMAPENAFDAMQNSDVFSRVSAELRCATSLASDLTILSSGPVGGIGELKLPEVQDGSSIMPGKVNPVLPMAIIQLSFAVVGNDVAVAQAVQYGQLEINHFEPVVASRAFDSITLLTNGIQRFGQKCVAGVKADVERNERHLLESMAVATALVPQLGYARVSKLARQSVTEGRSLVTILDESGTLPRSETLAAIQKASFPVFDN